MTGTRPDWIAVDWGTSNVRAWAMDGDRPLAEASSDKGMGKLAPEDFEPALLDLTRGWTDGPAKVIACGMVGARQGWVEAPYAMTPCPARPEGLTRAPTTTPGLDVRIIPGVAQSDPADVMRGEETQIAGFLARNPGWDGVICLPGTHTKWVHVSAAEIVSFQTFMTGEVFATLTTQTVLRHTVGTEGWDDAAFDVGLDQGMFRPERMAARLFSLRAEHLLHGLGPGAARARASGLLLGMELAGARPYWLGREVAVIGAGKVAGLYARALAAQGTPCRVEDGAGITLAGLSAVYDRMKETT
ncbi:MAG: 2-dehydro-3-deoxygalactonokinase [Rubellimicrobium sp.]|nr:2-dehydro-3-deoxygalactonokinase [Rubellimicrobium sp.]